MQIEVCLLLSLLVAPAMGGGQQAKRKIQGCDPPYPGNPLDPSPCRTRICTTSCGEWTSGWHYDRLIQACMRSDSRYCGAHGNHFGSCGDCSRACNVSVCAEDTTTKSPNNLPNIGLAGR
uniref:Putative der and-72 secreted protein n=1 Tax=Rhipicephalus pulchellus TaxID=72859 RepID=L7LY08_RHIPC